MLHGAQTVDRFVFWLGVFCELVFSCKIIKAGTCVPRLKSHNVKEYELGIKLEEELLKWANVGEMITNCSKTM